MLSCEICTATPAVRKHIREGDAHLLYSEMQTGRKHGMQTMDHALLTLYQRSDITYDMAVSQAREPNAIHNRATGTLR